MRFYHKRSPMKTQRYKLGRDAGKLFFLCFTAYMFSYFGRYDFSACQNAMITEGLIDLASASTMASAYFICYGAGQLINGALGVRITPKYMVACGLFGAGAANIMMGICPWRAGLAVIWGLNGIFNSMLWSPIIRAFSEWMDEPSRQRAGADISLTIPLGTVGSYIIPSLALAAGSWRAVFYITGALIAACGIVWLAGLGGLSEYITKMDENAAVERLKRTAAAPERGARGLTPAVFFATGLLSVAFAAVFNGALKEAVIQWIPQLFVSRFGMSDSTASLIATGVPLLGIAGPYLAIWIDRKFTHNECFTAAVLYGITFTAMLVLSLTGLRGTLPSVILIAVGVAAMWGVNTIFLTYLCYHFGGMGISSAVSGTLNCFIYFGSALASSLYGRSVAGLGWTITVNIWCAVSAAAVAASVIAGFVWNKKKPE